MNFTCGVPIGRFGSSCKAVVLSIIASYFCLARAEVGVSLNEILVGTSTNLSGKTAGIAVEFNDGITAYLNKINRAGGIYGRKIVREIHDDGYEPERTYSTTQNLIDKRHVFAL